MKKLFFLSILFIPAMTFAFEDEVGCYFKSWGLTARAGLHQAWYLDRTKTLNIAQTPQVNIVQSQIKIPKFSYQFETPWYVGGELAFNIDQNFTAFIEGNYTKAKGKTVEFIWQGATYDQEFSDYSAPGFYAGLRYYGVIGSGRFAPFIGGKFGLQRRDKIVVRQTIDSDPVTISEFDFFKSDCAVSGGLQLGFDLNWCQYFAFTVQAEALFTAPMKSNIFFAASPFPMVVVGNTGTVLSLPLSLGFKFNF